MFTDEAGKKRQRLSLAKTQRSQRKPLTSGHKASFLTFFADFASLRENGFLRGLILSIAILMVGSLASAEDVSKEQIKGLDEQVQEVKSDVLSIAAELNQLEEKLLYPSNTQVAVFVSLVKGETLRLDSVEIQLDGKPVADHLYSFKELEALQKGGVQRIYTGNIRTGEHDLQVVVTGKNGGSDFKKSESFKVSKDVGPKIVELSLTAQGITLR